MQTKGFKGEWNDGKNSIKVQLALMLFEEEGVPIAYIPALDISGYGATEQEAKESLEHSLNEYFSYTTNKKTLFDDLISHGWTFTKKTKPFIAPAITDIITKNEYLHNIVNSRPYKMDRMNVEMPEYV
jgi:hypothetical protein